MGIFAKELIEFLLQRNPQVSAAEVSVPIKRGSILQPGQSASNYIVETSSEHQTTTVRKDETASSL